MFHHHASTEAKNGQAKQQPKGGPFVFFMYFRSNRLKNKPSVRWSDERSPHMETRQIQCWVVLFVVVVITVLPPEKSYLLESLCVSINDREIKDV